MIDGFTMGIRVVDLPGLFVSTLTLSRKKFSGKVLSSTVPDLLVVVFAAGFIKSGSDLIVPSGERSRTTPSSLMVCLTTPPGSTSIVPGVLKKSPLLEGFAGSGLNSAPLPSGFRTTPEPLGQRTNVVPVGKVSILVPLQRVSIWHSGLNSMLLPSLNRSIG